MLDSLSRSDIDFMQSIADADNREFTWQECGVECLKRLKEKKFVCPVYDMDYFPRAYRLSQYCLELLKEQREAEKKRQAQEREEAERQHREEIYKRRSLWIPAVIAILGIIVSIGIACFERL